MLEVRPKLGVVCDPWISPTCKYKLQSGKSVVNTKRESSASMNSKFF